MHPTVSWVDRSCFQSGLPGTPTANESAHLVLPTEESVLPIHPTRLRECAGYLVPQDQGLYILQCSALQRIVLKMRNDRDTDRTYITG